MGDTQESRTKEIFASILHLIEEYHLSKTYNNLQISNSFMTNTHQANVEDLFKSNDVQNNQV